VRERTDGRGAMAGDASGPSGPRDAGATPGQMVALARSRAHALATLAEGVAETRRDIARCRDDPSWSGRAHDAFTRSLDELAGRVALAASLLHEVPATGSSPACSGAHA